MLHGLSRLADLNEKLGQMQPQRLVVGAGGHRLAQAAQQW